MTATMNNSRHVAFHSTHPAQHSRAHRYPGIEKENISFALCLLCKDESKDIVEWIEYHKSIGVSNVYIYDSHSSAPLLSHPGLIPHLESGFIAQYSYFTGGRLDPHLNQQTYAMEQCVSAFRHKHDFLGFIDTDEFIVIRDSSETVIDVLRRYQHFGGLVLYWLVFGSNGHIERPAGSVMSNYGFRCLRSLVHKSIVNTRHLSQKRPFTLGVTAHDFQYEAGYYAVDTNMHRVDPKLIPRPSKRDRDLYRLNTDLARMPPLSYAFDVMYLNHYATKSKSDFESKLAKRPKNSEPDAPYWNITWNYFTNYNIMVGAQDPSPLCEILRSRYHRPIGPSPASPA